MKSIPLIELFLAQKGKCFYCFGEMSFVRGACASCYTRDHFYPKKNGNRINGNCVLSCASCNERKGHREPNKAEKARFKALYRRAKERMGRILKIKKGEK